MHVHWSHRYFPLASVAALLVTASIRMVPVHFLEHLWTHDRKHFFLCLFTALVSTFEDPVVGILYGTLIAYLMSAMAATQNQDTFSIVDCRDDELGLTVRILVLW